MSWNGSSGYFVTDEEYYQLVADKSDEYLDELETEVHNHRNTIEEARLAAYDLYEILNNA